MTTSLGKVKAQLVKLEDAAQAELDKRRPVEFEVSHPMFAYGYWLGKVSGVGEVITLIDDDEMRRLTSTAERLPLLSRLEALEDELPRWAIPVVLVALAVAIALVLP